MTNERGPRSEGRLVLSAYRADLPAGGEIPQIVDSDALVVATLLRHALVSPNKKGRDRLVRSACVLARRSLGRRVIAAGCLRDRGSARSSIDLLRLFAERAERSGKLNLAENILETLAMLPEATEVQLGRILGDRGRLAWKLGFIELAESRYRELLRRGRRRQSFELQARAYLGFTAVAQIRGNFPEMKRMAQSTVRIASRHGLHRMASDGENALGIVAGMAGDFSRSVEHFWRGYIFAAGDKRLNATLLTNLAQSFYLANRPVEARAAASVVLRSSPAVLTAFPALGVFVLSSAALGRRADVEWSVKQTVQLAKVRGYTRSVASALFECAVAYEMIGESTKSGVLERRARAMAVKHGFHDLTFSEVSAMAHAPRQVTLARQAAAVATQVVKLGSSVMPHDLELAAAVER